MITMRKNNVQLIIYIIDALIGMLACYYAESEEKNNAEVIIAKNRHGATGSVFLQWIGQYTTFYNQDRRHE